MDEHALQECNLHPLHVSVLEMACGRAHNKATEQCKECQKKTLYTLLGHANEGMQHNRTTDGPSCPDCCMQQIEKDILARGLNFAPAPRRVPVTEIVAAVEDGLRRTSLPQQS